MNGLLVAGNFFVDRLNAQGQSTGIIGPINTTKLAIKADADEMLARHAGQQSIQRQVLLTWRSSGINHRHSGRGT